MTLLVAAGAAAVAVAVVVDLVGVGGGGGGGGRGGGGGPEVASGPVLRAPASSVEALDRRAGLLDVGGGGRVDVARLLVVVHPAPLVGRLGVVLVRRAAAAAAGADDGMLDLSLLLLLL